MRLRRAVCCALLFAMALWSQRGEGELRLVVTDPAGLPLPVTGTIVSRATGVSRSFSTDDAGAHVFRGLPFGPYLVRLEHPGFAARATPIEIRAAAPASLRVALSLNPVDTAIVIEDSATLLDASRTSAVQYIGPEQLRDRTSATPGRSVLEMVNMEPGWLLEANGVLHPRGSEYDTQYVINGVPILDNRSPSFAQALGIDEFESMTVRTGGYPAEYGRKLGGVIEVATERDPGAGFHGRAVLAGGSYAAQSGYASAVYRAGKTTVGGSVEGFQTDRYLDPPVEPNYTNHGSALGGSARLEEDWSGSDRTQLYFQSRSAWFLVPNELIQQDAGQRQDRDAGETLGLISHQHVFSPRILGTVRALVRDTSAGLWANGLSTPIIPYQERGFRETYVAGDLSAHVGMHEIKAGVDAILRSISENFAYHITAYEAAGMPIFDPSVPPDFRFADRRQNREQSGYIQDLIRRGNLALSLGVRYDHYRLVVDEWAISPRFAVSWLLPKTGLLLRASYDRAFQPPAIENVLLASSNLVDQLGGTGAFLPLRPSRANFFEAGFSKTIADKLRLDGCWFRRSAANFADDSLLFNTGVSFPVAFAHATVSGYEVKVEVPKWGRFAGYVSYSNMIGRGDLPAAGGLFLGDDADQVRGTGMFPISQDQRNTVRARVRCQLWPRLWMAWGGYYNSGLPVEIESDTDKDFLVAQFGQAIVDRVNFDRGRVRPSSAVDASLGADLWKREHRLVRLQADVLNLTGRLNVINFAGLFSGTAISPRRTWALRLEAEF
jgi:hypothetical protein